MTGGEGGGRGATEESTAVLCFRLECEDHTGTAEEALESQETWIPGLAPLAFAPGPRF